METVDIIPGILYVSSLIVIFGSPWLSCVMFSKSLRAIERSIKQKLLYGLYCFFHHLVDLFVMIMWGVFLSGVMLHAFIQSEFEIAFGWVFLYMITSVWFFCSDHFYEWKVSPYVFEVIRYPRRRPPWEK